MTRRGVLLFAALGLIWGVPYLFIKIAVAELTPEMLVLARCALAAVLLLPLAAHRRALAPVLRRWRPLLLFAVFEIVLPWYFLNSAEQRLPSSTSGLLLSAVPLAALGIAFVMGRRDRITLVNGVGIAVGMLGVAAIVGLDLAGSDLVGVAQLVVVVLGYALGPAILARWMSDLPGVGVMALALGISALIYVPVVLLTGGGLRAVPSPPTIVSVVVLAVFCSAIAFLIMFALVAEIGPIRMTAITYVNPAVAVVAGALVLGEQVTVWTIVGFVLILAGCYLVTKPARAVASSTSVDAPDYPPQTAP
ncbi:DMT family transporter [Protaetiibacter larvae]|uniref:DMT family transporter n=1 Tax=Protaetiibacter larvae TaxID=2592654 RepID=A0A5C1Y7V8_9MICO|nr:DMT family transporter [Protaetiibacter larvae]QEO09941.1 DMT family transporter [Protaetiibacter larvae]